jgi:transcriptional regulator
MKYIVALKYAQNNGFRELIAKTKGIIVEDTTLQNSSNSVLRWGCQDLQKKDLVKSVRSVAKKHIHTIEKEAMTKTALLKKPRSITAQQKVDAKLKIRIQAMEQMAELCERTILEKCHYTLVGENAMGKILTVLRDNNGVIDYKLEFPLYLFDKEIR